MLAQRAARGHRVLAGTAQNVQSQRNRGLGQPGEPATEMGTQRISQPALSTGMQRPTEHWSSLQQVSAQTSFQQRPSRQPELHGSPVRPAPRSRFTQ
jgi:hypothetical protein